LPAGWSDADVGAVGVPGSASYNAGTFTVSGSGDDVWGTADAFNYAYQTLSGDGQIIARVASLGNVASWSKAGVMIRGGLSANAPYAFMIVSAGKGTVFQYRTAAGAAAAGTTAVAGTAPMWVKLVRQGTMIAAYRSGNGTSWTLAGSASIPMSASVQIGLAVSSHVNSQLCAASFDHVSR
jgi:regulation of enolase protein 1 (concanavalin A-like superfamily)